SVPPVCRAAGARIPPAAPPGIRSGERRRYGPAHHFRPVRRLHLVSGPRRRRAGRGGGGAALRPRQLVRLPALRPRGAGTAAAPDRRGPRRQAAPPDEAAAVGRRSTALGRPKELIADG